MAPFGAPETVGGAAVWNAMEEVNLEVEGPDFRNARLSPGPQPRQRLTLLGHAQHRPLASLQPASRGA